MRRRDALKSVLATAGFVGLSSSPGSIEARDGTRIFHRDLGDGPPFLFVAPWALNSDWWEYQTAYLVDEGVRCVSYDRRGHGRSDHAATGYDFDTLADDLASVIERLELRAVTLVGHSMGCGEIIRYLSRHGSSRVKRVVLVSTITPYILKTSDNPDGVEKAALEKGREALARDRPGRIAAAAAAFFGAPLNPVSKEMMDWWARMMVDQCSLKTMLDLHRAFTETDFRPELRRMTLPTVFIHGDSDTTAVLELTARRSSRLVPGSELKVYEGAAHGLPITHRDRLSGELLAFTR